MHLMTLNGLRRDLRKQADPSKAKLLMRFFKTGPGEYAEGDKFIGVMVPQTRLVARKYRSLSLPNLEKLLSSAIHEERLCALLMLVDRYAAGDQRERARIFRLYLKNVRHINNWDLVDLSAPRIVGRHLENRSHGRLLVMAKSRHLWTRRIAILFCFWFIDQGSCRMALKVATILVHDEHDLIHKAVGWMLREVGKRCSLAEEERFLKKHFKTMPRTMLRYAIERFPEKKRKAYLLG